MSNLYFIVTNHMDFAKGPRKLWNLYTKIHPDILLEETNEIDLKKFQEFYSELEEGLMSVTDDKEGTKTFINFLSNFSGGFERGVNKKYSEAYGIPNYMIDIPGGQKKIRVKTQNMIKDMIKKARLRNKKINIKKLMGAFEQIGNLHPEKLNEQWQLLLRYEGTLNGELFFVGGRIMGRIGEPDKYMEQRIRELYNPDKTIAYPVGMLHALDSLFKSTLYSRIRDLNPIRIPLL